MFFKKSKENVEQKKRLKTLEKRSLQRKKKIIRNKTKKKRKIDKSKNIIAKKKKINTNLGKTMLIRKPSKKKPTKKELIWKKNSSDILHRRGKTALRKNPFNTSKEKVEQKKRNESFKKRSSVTKR